MPGSIAACSTSRPRSSAGAALTPDADAERADARGADPGAGRRARSGARPSRPGTATPRPRSSALGDAVLELEYTLIPHGLHVVGEAPSPRSASTCCWRSPRRRTARGPSARSSRRWSTGDARDALAAERRRDRRCLLRELAATDRLLARTTRSPASCTPSTAASSARRPAATCCAPRRSCRPAATCTASIPSAFPAPSRCRTARGRRSGCSRATPADGSALPEIGRHRAVGHRQPEDRGRPDRPGAGADRRRAALRQLRPPRRRRADPARRARPAADRRDGHAVGHLPRPAAAADQAAGRGRASSPPAPTSRSSRTSSASTRWPTRREHGCDLETGGAARLRQCRRRLRLQRQPPGRQRPLGRRGRAGRDLHAPQGLRLRPHRQAGAARRRCSHSVLAGVDLAYQNLDSVELGVTTVDHYFDTLGGISRAVRARQGRQSAPVYIGDQTRGDGTVRTLARAGGAGDPHPDAQSEMVRGHAQARLRGRAPDRGARHQHAWAGRRRPARWRPGSTSSSPRPSCSTRRCASGWRRSTRPPRPRSRTACSRRTSATTGRPTRRCSMPCGGPARSWRTGSKASA